LRSEELETTALSTVLYYQEVMGETLEPLEPNLFTLAGYKEVATAFLEHGARFGVCLESLKESQSGQAALIKIAKLMEQYAVPPSMLKAQVLEPLKSYKYGRAVEIAARESIALIRHKQVEKAAVLLREKLEEEADKNKTQNWKTAVHGSVEYLELLEKLLGPDEMEERILTGIPLIDKIINQSIGGGLHEGQIATIAARPGRGKSTVMAWLVSSVLNNTKDKVGIFSFEMTSRDIAKKLIDAEVANRGKSTRLEIGYARHASAVIADMEQTFQRVLIDDRSGLEVSEIIKAADDMSKDGVRLFFMDYIQRVKVGDVNPEALRVAFSEVVESLTLDAKRNKRIWILLSQFSRAAEGRPGTMADLKETSALEENSFFVFGLHRPHTVVDGVQVLDASRLEIHVLKNRFGQVGGVYPFRVNWPACKFESLGGV
jgi:replicative DNA helicase